MKISILSISTIASLAVAKGDRVGLRSANSAESPIPEDFNEAAASATTSNLLVDYLYTYGGPATVKHPHQSNPGNKCIPGIRVYTENVRLSFNASIFCLSQKSLTLYTNIKNYFFVKISKVWLERMVGTHNQHRFCRNNECQT